MSTPADLMTMSFSDQTPKLCSIDGMPLDSTSTAAVLQEVGRRVAIQELTLRNVTIDDKIADALEDIFALNDRVWTKVECIHCTGHLCRLTAVVVTKAQVFNFTGSVPIAHNPRYCIDVCSLKTLGRVGNALREQQTLETLILKGTRLSFPGLHAFCEGLATNECLRSLQMSHCAMDADHVPLLSSALAKNCHLSSLSFAHCRFAAATPVEHSVNDITDRRITPDPTIHFAELLEALAPHPALQQLHIFGIPCTARATQALSTMLLMPHSKLVELRMKNNISNPEDKVSLTSLLSALETNTRLEYLQLSGENVGDDDLEPLAKILSTSNSTLKTLHLTANNITDAGLRSLTQVLPAIKGLRTLDLQRNRFTTSAKKEVIAALKDNLEMERLDLDGTWDSTKSYYLSLNRGGRRLRIVNSVAPGLWPVILSRANALQYGRNQPQANLNVTYSLLHCPSFLALQTRGRKRSQDELIAEDQHGSNPGPSLAKRPRREVPA